jgi:hypothetical protein
MTNEAKTHENLAKEGNDGIFGQSGFHQTFAVVRIILIWLLLDANAANIVAECADILLMLSIGQNCGKIQCSGQTNKYYS